MNLHYEDDRVTLWHGDCIEVLSTLPDSSVDAVVCDPPYGLSNTAPDKVADTIVRWAGGDREHVPEGRGFMGRPWDSFVPPPAVWDECLRVLKPGGHMLVFAGSRTQDLMGLSIRLAGFELRDSLAWITGSGMPKSHDVSKAIDKAAGAEREVIGRKGGRYAYGHNPEKASLAPNGMFRWGDRHYVWTELPPNAREFFTKAAAEKGNITAPATPEAERWAGWGTALKPSHEPVLCARKPLTGTVAANVLEWGTGALNIDASRVAHDRQSAEWVSKWSGNGGHPRGMFGGNIGSQFGGSPSGRWPANVLLDPEAAAAMDQQSGVLKSGAHKAGQPRNAQSKSSYTLNNETTYEDAGSEGGASRFFHVFKYQAKAPKKERPVIEREDGTKVQHPTVKPLALMEWLVTLITPPGGVVLDPFAGSGTTLQAARDKGFRSIGIEADADHVALIHARLEQGSGEPDLFTCGSNR